jgi:tetratricopeptide (TPR) repeat protein
MMRSVRNDSMRRAVQLSVLGLSVALAGCASDKKDSQFGRVSTSDANALNAEHSSFENAEDPPLKAETYFAAGQLDETQGNLRGAAKQYENAVEVDAKNAKSLYRLGIVYAHMKNYPKAIDAWKRYIAATNNSATGYSNLGFCQELAHQPGEAELSYKKGISIDPKDRPCRVNYGLMLARQKRTNEAMLQWQAVLSPAEVHYNLASVYEQQGQKTRAKAEYQKALALDPSFKDAKARLSALE